MRLFIASVVALSVATALVSAAGAGAASGRPPGVSADDWAPLGDSLGVVLVHRSQSAAAVRSALPSDVAQGYLMVRRHDEWRRLVLIDPIKASAVTQ
jgi:hypothetical protein